jgi:hypothetical protein
MQNFKMLERQNIVKMQNFKMLNGIVSCVQMVSTNTKVLSVV